MKMHKIKPARGSRKKPMTVGRGNGSSRGTYCGRGGKGQTARTGGNRRAGFEGGQTPLVRRMPKLGGFKNPRRIEFKSFNLDLLATRFKDGETVERATLVEKKFLSSKNTSPIKILGNGEFAMNLTFKVDQVSASARTKIEAAKGTIELLGAPKKTSNRKKGKKA